MSLLSTPRDESVVGAQLNCARTDPAPRTDEPVPHYAARRGVFFTATAILYASFILLGVLTLNPYFAQTWDVTTFIHAAHRFLDGGNPFDLYAQSRVAQTWPYAYPPLHALVTAMALFAGNIFPVLPEYVWARLPALLADIGIGFTLYTIIKRKTNDQTLARIALLLWLFNPITFYDTAVQGHFESEWLLFVLLAYAWFEDSGSIILPTIALAVAVLFKQVAILFAIPVWAYMLREHASEKSAVNQAGAQGRRSQIPRSLAGGAGEKVVLLPRSPTPPLPRLPTVVVSLVVFALVVGAVVLPYLLYSNDFLYMNLTYVENVPVQTQSWIIALLGWTRASREALTSDFFLLRYQTIVTIIAAAAIAFFAARRGWGLYLAATLIAIAFFLTSKKVMGYYYVMLFPFLLVACLPGRRFDLILIAIVVTTWISLSPYYAAWGNPDHWWIYALLGTLNSVFFAWFFVRVVAMHLAGAHHSPPLPRSPTPARKIFNLRSAVFITLGLFAAAVSAAVLQPLIQSSASPIRAPIIAPGMESNAAIAFGIVLAALMIALGLIAWQTRELEGRIGNWAWGAMLIFAPLFFAVYTLTKESTAVFEIALKALGG